MGRRAAVGLREPCEPRRCVDENSAERLLAEQTLYCLISCVLNQIRRAYALQGPNALHFGPCPDLEKDSGDRISGRNSMKYLGKFGMPEWIRTTDLLLRRQTLYPSELRAHNGSTSIVVTFRPEGQTALSRLGFRDPARRCGRMLFRIIFISRRGG